MSTTRIKKLFKRLARENRAGFIGYITAGDPSLTATVDRVRMLEEAGVDLIELGVPFSDPLADGPVNQEAAHRALQAGATLPRVIETVANIRQHSDIPIVFFSYLNPFLAHGMDSMAQASAQVGVDGLLLLDLPVEEARAYRKSICGAGLDMIQLVTPTSPDDRIREITRSSSGFVYCVSRAGVTGARDEMDAGARGLVERIRRHTRLPVALGFGISQPEQAAAVARYADAVIVGSALVKRMHEADDRTEAVHAARQWVADMVSATHEARNEQQQKETGE